MSETNPPPLTELSNEFINAINTSYPNLIQLNLSYHHIATLPDSLCILTNLTDLDLSHNKFNDINNIIHVLSQLKHLNKLNISNNPIYAQPEGGNHVNHINSRIIDSLPSLHYLNGTQIRHNDAIESIDVSQSYDSSLDLSHSEYSDSMTTSYDASYNAEHNNNNAQFASTLDHLIHNQSNNNNIQSCAVDSQLNTTINNYNAFGNIVASAAGHQTVDQSIQQQHEQPSTSVNDTTGNNPSHMYNRSITELKHNTTNESINDNILDEYHDPSQHDDIDIQQIDRHELKSIESLESTVDCSKDQDELDTSLISPLPITPENKHNSGDNKASRSVVSSDHNNINKNDELNAAKLQIQQLQSDLKVVKTQLTNTEQQLTTVNSQLQSSIHAHAEQITILSQHSDHAIQSLTTQLNEITDQLQTQQKSYTELNTKYNELQSQSNTNNKLLHDSTAQLSITQSYVNELEQTNAAQSTQLNELKYQIEQLNVQSNLSIQQSNEQHNQQLTMLQTQLNTLQQQLQSEQQHSQSVIDQHRLHTQNLQNIHNDESRSLHTTVTQLQSQLEIVQQSNQAQANHDESNQRIIELENELKQLKLYYSAYEKPTVPHNTHSDTNNTLSINGVTHNDTIREENELLRIQLCSLQHVIELQQTNLLTRYPSTELALTQWRQQVTTLYVQLKNIIKQSNDKENMLNSSIVEFKQQIDDIHTKHSVTEQLYTASQANNKLLKLQSQSAIQRISDTALMQYNKSTELMNTRVTVLVQRIIYAHNQINSMRYTIKSQINQQRQKQQILIDTIKQESDAQLLSVNNEIKQLKSTNDRLTQQLKSSEINCTKQTDHTTNLQKQIDILTQQLHDITNSSHRAMIDVATQHNDTIHKLNTQINELNQQYNTIQKQYNDNVSTTNTTINQLEQQLNHKLQLIEELHKQLQQLKEQHSNEFNRLLRENNTLQSELIKQSLLNKPTPATHRYNQSVDYTDENIMSVNNKRASQSNATYIRIPDASITVTHPPTNPSPSVLHNNTNITHHQRKTSVLDPQLKLKIDSLTKLSNTLLNQ